MHEAKLGNAAQPDATLFQPRLEECDPLSFAAATPFPHCVLDRVLHDSVATDLVAEIPTPDIEPHAWFHYSNPIEQKYVRKTFDDLPAVVKLYDVLQSPAFVARVASATGIPNLEADPHLHGAGIHAMTRGGKLDMHLDYNVHPVSGKQRMVNLILYLGDWDPAWGGALQMFDAGFTRSVTQIQPRHNSALLFQTTGAAFHGIPTPIACPAGAWRKTVTVFYVANLADDGASRFKAEFRPLPWQPADARLRALYATRATRLLRSDDLWRGWERDGAGFW